MSAPVHDGSRVANPFSFPGLSDEDWEVWGVMTRHWTMKTRDHVSDSVTWTTNGLSSKESADVSTTGERNR